MDHQCSDAFPAFIIGTFPGFSEIHNGSGFTRFPVNLLPPIIQSILFPFQLSSPLIQKLFHIAVDAIGEKHIYNLLSGFPDGLNFQLDFVDLS